MSHTQTHTHIHSFTDELPSHRQSHRLHLHKPSLAAHDAFSTCCGTSRQKTSIILLAQICFSGALVFICGHVPRFFLFFFFLGGGAHFQKDKEMRKEGKMEEKEKRLVNERN